MRHCIMEHRDSLDQTVCRLLQEARSIAVVGLSDKPWRDSHRVAAYLLQQGYQIIPVNPEIAEVFGRKCLPDLLAAEVPIDLVNVFRKKEHISGIVDQAIRTNAGAIWTQYGLVDHESARRAQSGGIPVVMDRCIMVEHARHFG